MINYSHKIIVSGDEIEVYTYRFKQSKIEKEETAIVFDDETEKPQEKKQTEEVCDAEYKRKKDNIRKMKIKLRRLINANAFQYEQKDKFVTLTFSEFPTRKEVVQKFHNFKIRLKRKYPNVEYIAVIERGTKGTQRLHLHCIFFNLPYVPQKEFQKIWKYGRVDIQAIDSFYDLANYILKYIEKTVEDGSYIPKGKRFYFPSKGLKKPSEFHMLDETATEFIEELCSDKDVVCEFDFSSDYCGDCHYVKYKKLREVKPIFRSEEDLIFYLNSI